MNIRVATQKDFDFLFRNDRHIAKEELTHCIARNRIYIAERNSQPIGWLRYNLFWDNTPFMNMLYLFKDYRGMGYGKNLVEHWEEQMKLLRYESVMTSTASDEYAQHFYIKMGYHTIGGFTFLNDPYEIILMKLL